ncbi:MAG: hypothetical protein ABW167_17370 [Baekduia sp.]
MTGSALARILWRLGEHEQALEVMAHAVATVDRLGTGSPARGHAEALVRGGAALIELDAGHPEEARRHVVAAYPAAVGTDDGPVVALAGLAVAALALHDGAPRNAAEILGAAARLRGSADRTSPEVVALTARLRDELGDAAFEAAFAAGRALDRDAALARLEPASYTLRP